MVKISNITSIEPDEAGIPRIRWRRIPFSLYGKFSHIETPETEVQFYDLLHVLFDEYEDIFNYGLNDAQRQEHMGDIHKDRLSSFLEKALSQAVVPSAASQDPVDLAMQHLTVGDTQKAAQVLLESKNLTLSMLVAQLPNADESFQDNILEQLNKWREQNVISEIELNIRAIYELLSGNTTISEGKSGPIEHKAASFSISQHFGLGWLTMFAMKLWYSRCKNGSIEDIIANFFDDIATQKETSSPILNDGSEDPLWVALRLYASLGGQDHGDPHSLVFPQALSALGQKDGWSTFSVFRAHHALVVRADEDQSFDIAIDLEAEKQLIITTAAEFEFKGHVPAAVYVLLHLRDGFTRATAIQELLHRNAVYLPRPPAQDDAGSAGKAWQLFTSELGIPEAWLYQSLALLTRSEVVGRESQDTSDVSFRELTYLIKAGEADEAHRCLVERVAPVLVINEDWSTLGAALDLFSKVENLVLPATWNSGGAVYNDFFTLVGGKIADDSKHEALSRVRKGISNLWNTVSRDGQHVSGEEGVEMVRRRVAVREMARMVADMYQDDLDTRSLLELPLTSDLKQRLGRDLAAQYLVKTLAAAA